MKYIFDLQTRYEDGENINAEMLMERAAQKYKNMSTRGIWEAASPEDEKLLALTTTIEALKAKMNKPKKPPRKKAGRSKHRKSGKGKSEDIKEKPAWFRKKPGKQEMKQPKEWNGAWWHYCSPETGGKCPGKWRIHKPEDCKTDPTKSNGKGKPAESKKSTDMIVQQAVDDDTEAVYMSE